MCNCISEINQQLKESGKNTMLDIPIVFSMSGGLSGDKVTISTCKREDKKREKPLRLFAMFCPFCGEKYPSREAVEQSVHPTPPTARSISVTCPKCGTFIGVDFANTAGG